MIIIDMFIVLSSINTIIYYYYYYYDYHRPLLGQGAPPDVHTPSPPTNIVDFGGFDSSTILI